MSLTRDGCSRGRIENHSDDRRSETCEDRVGECVNMIPNSLRTSMVADTNILRSTRILTGVSTGSSTREIAQRNMKTEDSGTFVVDVLQL